MLKVRKDLDKGVSGGVAIADKRGYKLAISFRPMGDAILKNAVLQIAAKHANGRKSENALP